MKLLIIIIILIILATARGCVEILVELWATMVRILFRPLRSVIAFVAFTIHEVVFGAFGDERRYVVVVPE